MGISAGRDQMLAFRLNSHHLAIRLAPASMLLAAGACGIQNTPPGSAALALNARLAGLTPGEVDRALVTDKSLLQAWSLRASPYVFPTRDAAVFTLGMLPADEESIRLFIPGVEAALDRIGISATQVVDLGAAGLPEILDGRALTKDELGVELARWVLPHLTASQQVPWQSPSWYASGQSLGESVMRFVLPVLALRGLCCHADRRGNKAYIVRFDQWVTPIPVRPSHANAGEELVRRYLHCFGPSTALHFSEWAGIAPAQADRSWALVVAELVQIDYNGQKTWLLQDDLTGYQSPSMPEEVHFLPPHDPFLDLRDREALISDKALQRQIWRRAGNPGVVLAGGSLVGTWRTRKKGERLKITLENWMPLPKVIRTRIEVEAATLAPFRNCTSVEVEFTQ